METRSYIFIRIGSAAFFHCISLKLKNSTEKQRKLVIIAPDPSTLLLSLSSKDLWPLSLTKSKEEKIIFWKRVVYLHFLMKEGRKSSSASTESAQTPCMQAAGSSAFLALEAKEFYNVLQDFQVSLFHPQVMQVFTASLWPHLNTPKHKFWGCLSLRL